MSAKPSRNDFVAVRHSIQAWAEQQNLCVEALRIRWRKWLKAGGGACLQSMQFYFLPPYILELNQIEIVWEKMKYEWLPFQSFTLIELQQAIYKIEAGFGSEYQLTFC